MGHLGSLKGIGELFDGKKSLGVVTYQIDVIALHGLKEGPGSLRFVSDETLSLFDFAERTLSLRMENGERVAIVLTTPDINGASFRTTGRIPGF